MKAPRRNRVIAFRSTESEYQGLKSTGDTADSYISKGARKAIPGLIETVLPDDSITGHLAPRQSEADNIPDADKKAGGANDT
jgi:hypothetical protein